MWCFGWRFEGEIPQVERAVLIAAPHTSNWDLPHMLATAWVLRLRVSWLGKHTLFRGPFGWLFRKLGGIPVDRRAPQGLVQQVADALRTSDKLIVAVPPSGTRSRAALWKSGFYWIAHTAGVPVVCGYLDFATRRASLGYTFEPTGDVKADMDRVRAFYDGVRGKHPDFETPILLKEELPGTPEQAAEALARAEAAERN